MTIKSSKTPGGISHLLGITLIMGVMKPFIDTFSLNAGVPVLGVLFGIVFLFLLFFIVLFTRDLKLYQAEIPLYLLGAMLFIQIFNPYTSIDRGISSFLSFFFLPILIYFISSRVLKSERDVKSVIDVLYWFSVVALFYGIYTSLFGKPPIFAFPDGEYFSSSGDLRVRSITGSEQTYFIIVIFSLFMSYPKNFFFTHYFFWR